MSAALFKSRVMIQCSNDLTARQRLMFNALMQIARNYFKEVFSQKNIDVNNLNDEINLYQHLDNMKDETVISVHKSELISMISNGRVRNDELVKCLDTLNLTPLRLDIFGKEGAKEKLKIKSMQTLIPEIDLHDTGEIKFTLSKQMVNRLLFPRSGNYAVLDLETMIKLKTKYEIALYEYIVDYMHVTKRLSISELKEFLKYDPKETKHLIEKINKALIKINANTNIEVSLIKLDGMKREIKSRTGKVEFIQFFSKYKEKEEKKIEVSQVVQRLAKLYPVQLLDLALKEIPKFLEKYSEERIAENIKYADKLLKKPDNYVENPMAYIAKAINQDYAKKVEEEKAAMAEIKKENAQKTQADINKKANEVFNKQEEWKQGKSEEEQESIELYSKFEELSEEKKSEIETGARKAYEAINGEITGVHETIYKSTRRSLIVKMMKDFAV